MMTTNLQAGHAGCGTLGVNVRLDVANGKGDVVKGKRQSYRGFPDCEWGLRVILDGTEKCCRVRRSPDPTTFCARLNELMNQSIIYQLIILPLPQARKFNFFITCSR